MKRTILSLFLISACSLAVAQDMQDRSSSHEQQGKRITITGCLQSGTTPNSFMLSNAKSSDMEPQSQSRSEYGDQSQNPEQQGQNQPDQMGNESQGQMPSEMARSENNYMLIPEGKVDLKSHIGQRVEITGQMMKSGSKTMESTESSTPSGSSSSSRSSSEMSSAQPQIKVRSIRSVAQSCQ
jgi:hypothetical protein